MNGAAKFVNSDFWSPVKATALPQPWPPVERFWDRLNRLQRAMGLENKDIARIAGCHIGTVSAWRKRNPDTDQLLKLAEFFHVSPQWLLNGTEGALTAVDSPTEPPTR